MPYQSAAGSIYTYVPGRVQYLSTRLGSRSHLSLVRTRAGRRVGGYPVKRLGATSSAQATTNLVGAGAGVAANAILPGSGSIVQPVIDSLAQVFASNPATGKDAERQAKMYSYYAGGMTAPGSAQSLCDVQTLEAIALQGVAPACAGGGQQNNPQATRTYAQEALQALASQGWIGVNTPNPQYIGVPQSGNIYAANAQGQQQVVAQASIPITSAGLATELATNPIGALTSNPLLLVGGGLLLAFLLSGRSKSAKAA